MLKSTAFPLTIFILCIPSFAWGPRGHRVAADVARHRLTPLTRQKLVSLLGSDDLASISTWADEIRNERTETFGWHFVDIPWNANGFSKDRDCFKPDERRPSSLSDHQNCAVERIVFFRKLLADQFAPRSTRVEALKFLVHLVADLHQPMHATGEARGGNDIEIREFGKDSCRGRPCNLHSLWDVGLTERSRQSEREHVAELERLIVQRNLTAISGGTPTDWANESFHLAHEVWLPEGSLAGEEYYRRNISVANRQLALAGIRLAALLNECLGN
jgi:hypothetical protein